MFFFIGSLFDGCFGVFAQRLFSQRHLRAFFAFERFSHVCDDGTGDVFDFALACQVIAHVVIVAKFPWKIQENKNLTLEVVLV